MICIIGGSSFMFGGIRDGFAKKTIDTKYGCVEIFIDESMDVAVLDRHGGVKGYVPPHMINHRANMQAVATLEPAFVIGFVSTGSLKAAIGPGTILIPDDYISLLSPVTFFDGPERKHISPALSGKARNLLIQAVASAGLECLQRGVYFQTTGPRFETCAEIRMMASFADVVGMTGASEAVLAQELGLEFAMLAIVDNYANGVVDEPLSFESFKQGVQRNEHNARLILDSILKHA